MIRPSRHETLRAAQPWLSIGFLFVVAGMAFVAIGVALNRAPGAGNLGLAVLFCGVALEFAALAALLVSLRRVIRSRRVGEPVQ